jgi:hypothetical protein
MLQIVLGPSNGAFLILLTSLTLVLICYRYRRLISTLHISQCSVWPCLVSVQGCSGDVLSGQGTGGMVTVQGRAGQNSREPCSSAT